MTQQPYEITGNFSDYEEAGKTGLLQFNGYIFEDFLKEWHGREAYKRANEMRLNSPVIGALLASIEQAIRKVTWTFTSEEGEDDPRLEILENSRNHMSTSFGTHIIEALGMLPFGFSIFEVVYQRWEDGTIIWQKLAPRGQDTVLHWIFDDNGAITGFTQQAAPRYEIKDLPVDKLLIYRTRSEKNNPEGRSILRQAWLPYYYAKNLMQIEAIGIERDLAGLPVIKLPQSASTGGKDTDDAKAAKMVRNIRQDEQAGIVLPNGWELELLSTGGSRQFDTNAIIGRYESRIMMSAMAQFLMLGQNGKGGSQALSADQSHLFQDAVNTPADIIAEEITHQAIPKLMRLNGYEAEGLKLEHSPAGDVDMNIMAAALQQVASLLTWSTQDEIWLRDVLRLPSRSPEDIDADKDAKQAQAAEMMKRQTAMTQAKAPAQTPDGNRISSQQDNQQEEGEGQMGADLFMANPTDGDQRLWEKRLKQLTSDFFARQKGRVVKAAKGMIR